MVNLYLKEIILTVKNGMERVKNIIMKVNFYMKVNMWKEKNGMVIKKNIIIIIF